MKKIGVYIHIPFCKQKCYYCDFVSFVQEKDIQKRYVNSLIKEIEEFKKQNIKYEISTIYIGGGTPSYIDSKSIKRILDIFDKRKIEEITLELNPGTVNKAKLEDYKKSGINRLSIGLQSSNDKILKTIGRVHNFQDFINAYSLAREVGFKNINVDLMIGLPGQKIEDLKESLEEVVKLKPEHISVYSLIVEEETKLANMIKKKKVKLPDEESERNMYWYTKIFLELHGYNQYEISNFAQKGYESKHNLDCWNQKEYLGFGIAAHSYINDVRFSNTNILEDYMRNCENDELHENVIIQEKQDIYSKEQEYMLLGLRKIEGVSIQAFKDKFADNPIYIFGKELNKLSKEELIEIEDDNIKLTNKGLDFANIVWEEFV